MIEIKIPLDLEKIIEITDPIYTFNEIIEQIDLTKFYKGKMSIKGRPRYDAEKIMKVALFAFMENGYASLRNIEKLCRTDVRYIWLLDGEKAPSHMTVCNFLNDYVGSNINELFTEINKIVFEREGVDLSRLYIDGTKIEANANKYTWVWKKSCQTSRGKIFGRVTGLIKEINNGMLQMLGLRIEPREEYAIEYLEQIIERFATATGAAVAVKHGRGHHKTTEQRQYDKLCECLERLKKYDERIEI